MASARTGTTRTKWTVPETRRRGLECLRDAPQHGDRPKPGGSCRGATRTAGPPFCDGVIAMEGTVHHRASNLEHQMRAAWRPTHLLLGVDRHPFLETGIRRDQTGLRGISGGRRVSASSAGGTARPPGNWKSAATGRLCQWMLEIGAGGHLGSEKCLRGSQAAPNGRRMTLAERATWYQPA